MRIFHIVYENETSPLMLNKISTTNEAKQPSTLRKSTNFQQLNY